MYVYTRPYYNMFINKGKSFLNNTGIFISIFILIVFLLINYNKCYIKTKFQNPYEQTLMSHCYQETIKGNINPSVLLLTPTEHNRFDFYSSDLRKEC